MRLSKGRKKTRIPFYSIIVKFCHFNGLLRCAADAAKSTEMREHMLEYIIIGLAAILLIGACIFSFRIDNSGKEDAITDNPKTK